MQLKNKYNIIIIVGKIAQWKKEKISILNYFNTTPKLEGEK